MCKHLFKTKVMLLLAMLLGGAGFAWAETVTDRLTQETTGVTGTTYADWSGKSVTSEAVYAGQSAGGNGSIQLRSNNNNSGVITTVSGGTLKSVSVTWNASTTNNRTLNVYGKNTAYSAATDLYDSSKQGTLLGTIVCGTSTTLTISGEYNYIGVRSASGAMYLEDLVIDWEVSTSSSIATPTFNVEAGEVAYNTPLTISSEEGTVIYYTTDGSDPLESETAEDSGDKNTVTFNITADMTVRAIATDGNDFSNEAKAIYTIIRPAAPSFSLASGGVEAGTEITISAPANCYVAYTTDAADTNVEGNAVEISDNSTATLTINQTTTILAKTMDEYGFESSVVSATYTVMVFETVSTLPYEESFSSDFGKFQADGSQVGGTNVWAIDTNNQYAKATAYVNSVNHDAESWLISPIINLAGVVGAQMQFSQCINKYFGTVADEAMVYVREKNGEWNKQAITYPTLSSSTWSPFENQVVDLSSYVGKEIQVAFVYVGTSTKAGTWEVKNFSVTTKKLDATLNVSEDFSLEVTQTKDELYTTDSDGAVTITSSDASIASVSEGVLTANKPGTAVITVSVAASDTYNAISDEFTVTVTTKEATEPVGPATEAGYFEKVTATEDITDGEYLIVYENVAFDGSLETLDAVSNTIDITFENDGTITETEENKAAVFTIEVTAGTLMSASGQYIGKTANSNGLDAKANTAFTNTFVIDNEGNAVITASGGCTLRYNATSGQDRFRYYKSGQQAIQLYKYVAGTSESTFSIDISEAKWRTMVSSSNVEFPTEVKAYIVSSITDNSVALKQVNAVKAGVPVLLNAEAGSYTMSVADDADCDNTEENQLLVSTVTTGNGVFVLANKSNGVGFYKWTGGALGAGRVYLPAPASGNAREFLSFDNEATGISSVNAEQQTVNGCYDLQGRRVMMPTKGLYIVNGKKVIK